MRSHPTAGQASVEYVVATALVAALFVIAVPAAGGPPIARAIVDQFKRALCLVGGDFCSAADARAAGLEPCPLRSRVTGVDGSATVVFVEAGGRATLAVTPLSDGTVSVVRSVGGSVGVGAGGFDINLGPVVLAGGPDGSARFRLVGAAGWVFPDLATATRFLAHSVRNAFDGQHWPWSWRSGERGSEVAASIGLALGKGGAGTLSLAGASAALQLADGVRRFRDGSFTTYRRVSVDGPDVNAAFLPPVTTVGRNEWISEATYERDGRVRDLVLRRATTLPGGRRISETVGRLDLRQPANYALARPLLTAPTPLEGAWAEVMRRMATDGIVERYTSTIADHSRGGSISVKAGVKLSVGARQHDVVRRLVDATATVRGAPGRRLDCLPEAP